MEHLENEHHYVGRHRPFWLPALPAFRLWHTILLVLVTGIAGWYAVYRVAIRLVELLSN